ncbi:GNAT family N-acetyltransferase [Knoellia sp. 3-2P3]|uniref:GNAT family N-acetyltransferase n=1 Tax=unclassified Knoellia TaxID=2618719 RepID=UPI0023DC9642|nr:GNAT family N-acetyltransferase [Knoellia sp. 3-2P3]MDF2092037.1 GNAT family N-acetyltransferase [Knoellia sp. 3-2P3]
MRPAPPSPTSSRPSPLLRPIEGPDVDAVLALNEANVELLAPMDEARLDQLRAWSLRADVVEVGGEFAGFVITMGPGTAYDSANYRWFAQRYGTGFHYLDRIVLSERFRRCGLGSAVYDIVETDAAARVGLLTLEVNADPPNPASLAFHAGRGYTEVGRLGAPGKTVAMMAKHLTP